MQRIFLPKIEAKKVFVGSIDHKNPQPMIMESLTRYFLHVFSIFWVEYAIFSPSKIKSCYNLAGTSLGSFDEKHDKTSD